MIAENGILSMTVASAQGMMVSGIIFDLSPSIKRAFYTRSSFSALSFCDFRSTAVARLD